MLQRITILSLKCKVYTEHGIPDHTEYRSGSYVDNFQDNNTRTCQRKKSSSSAYTQAYRT